MYALASPACTRRDDSSERSCDAAIADAVRCCCSEVTCGGGYNMHIVSTWPALSE